MGAPLVKLSHPVRLCGKQHRIKTWVLVGTALTADTQRITRSVYARIRRQPGMHQDRPLAYGVVFLRLGGGLGCFSPAIDNYID
jgi:hypothetical protein